MPVTGGRFVYEHLTSLIRRICKMLGGITVAPNRRTSIRGNVRVYD